MFRWSTLHNQCIQYFSKFVHPSKDKINVQDDFFDSTPEQIQAEYLNKSEDFDVKDEAESKIGNENRDPTENLTMLIEERFAKNNLYEYDQKFSDKIRVFTKGGTGGNGCYSIHRESYNSGTPDGGDGGKGGDVYFRASTFISNLYQLRKSHFFGNPGKHASSNKRNGKEGKDVRHNVPLGTEIYKVVRADPWAKTKAVSEYREFIADLDTPGKEVLVAKGGQGGFGNYNHRYLTEMDRGKLGDEIEIELVLKTIADVGLVGFPNAGKSTFLASVTRAFPKIAPYPFTTLRPYVGNWRFTDGKRMIIADLPGLIEGAHENKGLGHEFLRHIERTKVICYIIDGSSDELKHYEILYDELQKYNPKLLSYKSLILVNKSDRAHTKFKEKFKNLQEIAHTECIPISAKDSINLEKAILKLRGLVFNETEEETYNNLKNWGQFVEDD